MALIKAIVEFLQMLFAPSPFKEGGPSGEVPSPSNPIDLADVHHDAATKRLTIDNIEGPVQFALPVGTNSMEPIDAGHILIMSSAPKYMDDLNVGDIVIHGGIIHAIFETGEDAEGWWCRTRGWNCVNADSGIFRKADILCVNLITIWAKAR